MTQDWGIPGHIVQGLEVDPGICHEQASRHPDQGHQLMGHPLQLDALPKVHQAAGVEGCCGRASQGGGLDSKQMGVSDAGL